jgi:hypothetical protein
VNSLQGSVSGTGFRGIDMREGCVYADYTFITEARCTSLGRLSYKHEQRAISGILISSEKHIEGE